MRFWGLYDSFERPSFPLVFRLKCFAAITRISINVHVAVVAPLNRRQFAKPSTKHGAPLFGIPNSRGVYLHVSLPCSVKLHGM